MGIGSFFSGVNNAIDYRMWNNKISGVLKRAKAITSNTDNGFIKQDLVDELRNAHAAYKKAAMSGSEAKIEGEHLEKIYKEIKQPLKDAEKHFGDIKSLARGQKLGRVVSSKYFLVPAAIAAATVIISKISSSRKKHQREELVENRNQKIEALTADIADIKENTMMGMQPVRGDHATRVLAARSGAAAGVDTSNPAMSAMPYEVVRS